MNEEEEVEKESRLPPEKLKAIEVLAASGMTNTEIAEAVDCSRKTAARYRPAETDGQQQEAQEEGEAEGKVPELDTESSAAIFSIFDDDDGTPVDAIKQGYQVDQVSFLWERFCQYKGIEHPKRIKKKLDWVAGSLENLLMNIEFVVLNAYMIDGKKDIVWCPRCGFTHLYKNDDGRFVCAKCERPLFQVYDDE